MSRFSVQATIYDDDSEEEVMEPETIAEFDSQEEAVAFLNHVMDVSRENGMLRGR